MSSGRTGALLMQCVGEDGDESRLMSVVVKASGNAQTSGGYRSLLSEALGAQLALYFGLACPAPAVVSVSRRMANSVPDTGAREELTRSIGPNFGTRLLPGLELFLDLADRDRAMAGNVFAFDLLIENQDRQMGSPNLFVSNAGLVVLDHEYCFRWDDPSSPCRLNAGSRRKLVKSHVLHRFLRGTAVDFQPFLSKLAGLSDSMIGAILADLPREWLGVSASRIAACLIETRSDISGFERTLMEAIV